MLCPPPRKLLTQSHVFSSLPPCWTLFHCPVFRVLPGLPHMKKDPCHSLSPSPILFIFTTCQTLVSHQIPGPCGQELCPGHCPLPSSQTLVEGATLTFEQIKWKASRKTGSDAVNREVETPKVVGGLEGNRTKNPWAKSDP